MSSQHAPSSSSTPHLTPAQKRRLRKKKLEEKTAEEAAGGGGNSNGAEAATPKKTNAATQPTTPSASTSTSTAATPKPKGKKLAPTPAFIPSSTQSDADSGSDSDSSAEDARIITSENYDKKRSISALSAKQVLAHAEEQRRKEAAMNGDDGSDEEVLTKKSKTKNTKTNALVSDSDSDNDAPTKKHNKKSSKTEDGLTINAEYAAKYSDTKRKQMLSKKGSRGDVIATMLREGVNAADVDSEDDEDGAVRSQLTAAGIRRLGRSDDESTSESEDEDGELLTEEVNTKISQTISAIRSKQQDVYDSKKTFFTEEEMERIKAQKLKEKEENAKNGTNGGRKMNVRDVLANQLLDGAGGGGSSDDSDADNDVLDSRSRLLKLQAQSANKPLTYTEQQKKLKADFLKGVEGEDGEGDSDDDEDVFKVKKGGEARMMSDVSDDDEGLPAAASSSSSSTTKPSKSKSSTSKSKSTFTTNGKGVTSETSAAFLESYMNQEWWKEKDLSKLPTYRDIKGEDLPEENVDDEEDEKNLEQTETFEHAYNFRFEEPNAAYQIKSYPRPNTIVDSIRQTESKRKQARDKANQAKEEEKLKKKEEIARLKAEKRKELSKKMKELEEITGLKNATSKINLNELLHNWDPAKHDELMASLFNDDFYNEQGDEEMDEEQLREIVLKGEDMAALGMGKMPTNEEVGGVGSKKKKKNTKPLDPTLAAGSESIKKVVEAYQDLDTAGLLAAANGVGSTSTNGGAPTTSFKWKQVEPASYGMTIDEILSLSDKELNQKISLKKLATYRTESEDGDKTYQMPYKQKREEKFAKMQEKMVRKEKWNKTNQNQQSSQKKKQQTTSESQKKSSTTSAVSTASSTPAASSSSSTPSTATAAAASATGQLSASQKRRARKKKLEELTGTTSAPTEEGQGNTKKQKTQA